MGNVGVDASQLGRQQQQEADRQYLKDHRQPFGARDGMGMRLRLDCDWEWDAAQ